MKKVSIKWIILTGILGFCMFNNINCFAGGNSSKLKQDEYGEIPMEEESELNIEIENENQRREANQRAERERKLKQAIANLQGEDIRIYGKDKKKPVQFPQMIIHISPYLQKEIIEKGTGEIHLPNISRKSLRKLEKAIDILSYQAKDENGNSVPLEQITEKTEFKLSDVKTALNKLEREGTNMELGDLFFVSYYLQIDILKEVLASFIAWNIRSYEKKPDTEVLKEDLFAFRFGLFEKEQLEFLQKFVRRAQSVKKYYGDIDDSYCCKLGYEHKMNLHTEEPSNVKEIVIGKGCWNKSGYYVVTVKNTGPYPLYFNIDGYIKGELNVGQSIQYKNVLLFNELSQIVLESRKRKRHGSGYEAGAEGEVIWKKQNTYFGDKVWWWVKTPLSSIEGDRNRTDNQIKVFLKKKDGKEIPFFVYPDESVDSVYDQIYYRLGYWSRIEFQIRFKSAILRRGRLLSYYGIKNESTLNLKW